jgi:hypothetical protein
MLKKGDIIYFDPKTRVSDSRLEDKKHPIICLEDVNNSMENFLSAILSTDANPHNSNVMNVEIDTHFFSKEENYSIPGVYKHEYLVSMGIWKEIPQLPPKEDGKISLRGVNWVLCELLKYVPDKRQEELYQKLISLVRNYAKIEYVKTDIRTHINNNNFKNY